MPAPENAVEWRGHDMVDRDGDKIGSIEEIYLDAETDRPEWALVQTGLFGTRSTFVPLEGASLEEDAVRVPHEKGVVKDAPNIDREGQLSQEEEEQLYRYYGREYSPVGERGGTGEETPAGTAEEERQPEAYPREEAPSGAEAPPTAAPAPADGGPARGAHEREPAPAGAHAGAAVQHGRPEAGERESPAEGTRTADPRLADPSAPAPPAPPAEAVPPQPETGSGDVRTVIPGLYEPGLAPGAPEGSRPGLGSVGQPGTGAPRVLGREPGARDPGVASGGTRPPDHEEARPGARPAEPEGREAPATTGSGATPGEPRRPERGVTREELGAREGDIGRQEPAAGEPGGAHGEPGDAHGEPGAREPEASATGDPSAPGRGDAPAGEESTGASRSGAGSLRLKRHAPEENREVPGEEPHEARPEGRPVTKVPPHSEGVPPDEPTDEFGRPNPPEEGRLG